MLPLFTFGLESWERDKGGFAMCCQLRDFPSWKIKSRGESYEWIFSRVKIGYSKGYY